MSYLSILNYALGFVSSSRTSLIGPEQGGLYSDHTTTAAGRNTGNRGTPYHHSAPPRHNDFPSEQSSKVDEPARSARKEPNREITHDLHHDRRDATSRDIQRRIPLHEIEGKKEFRTYRKEDMGISAKDNEKLKEKLRKAQEDIRGLQHVAKRDAEAANQLRSQLESQHRHGRSMEDKIRQQTADLSALKEQLRRAEASNSQKTELLGVRTAELKGALVFLTKADSFAGADLIKMVESLNSEIFQGAAFMSEELEFEEKARNKASSNTQIMERARKLIGTAMLTQLLAKPPKVDPLPLQFALQSIMILRWIKIIQSFCPLEYRDHSNFLQRIHTGIQASEEQAVAGRWRAMTLAQLRTTPASQAYAPFIAEELVNILIVCGLSTNNTKYKTIIQGIETRVSLLEKAALKLKVALKEGVTSVDIEPFYISSEAHFDPMNMDNAYGDRRTDPRNPRNGERIMCTTDMGLRRVVKRSVDGQIRSEHQVILKPKVVLASFLADEAEAQTTLGRSSR